MDVKQAPEEFFPTAQGANQLPLIPVQFDTKQGPSYTGLMMCCLCTCASSCLCLPCAPCVYYVGVKEFESQQAVVDDKRIHFRSGWVNRKEKTVPLDRIQDIAIEEGLIQRCFGVSALLVQTAGNGGGENAPRAEIILSAPIDARNLRTNIIQRRDAIVFNQPLGTNALVAGAGVDFVAQRGPVTQQPRADADTAAMVAELRALRESVARIERTVQDAAAQHAR
eukprot:Unigene3538_Nuclearia_a/m.10805 Unigene3538_Nuclearia_a/g.10805  ORF Unigene3538_Nuclearia_a/g.10805 Unigene3538_Nuclearia_a/m.10805 type:complete len:224 (+) Unigene3538_Nuclearia_a:93-764(+)